ncbi:MAG: NADH-quinone oxidoreductase subunit G [Chloroflexi bacterium]|nr:NADH-quinone oxidoreductase subunit G [Chloroflexota bacterium]
MSEDKIKLEIDGREINADKGQMLIEVTDKNDIYIPRFCYHKKLTVAANCRMCLVEVEKAPKPLPACSTPVMDGMKVRTHSKLAIEAQKSVMEFLLINHPLDCPICDQGGECELQDLAMGYGSDVSRYQERKRVVMDKNIGPLIQTDLTRCIHCTRCVRFGEEIAGIRELGATGRGENMEIGTYIEKSVSSELSGNVIDLCPVGALTSKPFRYSARTWELTQHKMIAPHDSVGSNIYLHIKGDAIKRVVPAENEAINETWISDRDRFSYEAINSNERLHFPMVKERGIWKEVDWQEALNHIKEKLDGILNQFGPNQHGMLTSSSSTLEELYLAQKLTRALGSNNIDSRLKQIDFTDDNDAPRFPWLGQSITDFEENQAALLIGSNVRKDQPIVNHRLRKSVLNGALVTALNPIDYEFNFPLHQKIITAPSNMVNELLGILKAVIKLNGDKADTKFNKFLTNITVDSAHQEIANSLYNNKDTIVLLGNFATTHPQLALLRTLAGEITKLTHSKLGYLSESANSSGVWLAGALPHRLPGGKKLQKNGLNCHEILTHKLKSYFLLGVEPELECWDPHAAKVAMERAELVVALTAFQSEAFKNYADVLLPIGTFAETSGTYINNEGTVQRFNGAVVPQVESRPAWKVLRALANQFNLEGFDYESSAAVYDEVMSTIGTIEADNIDKWKNSVSSLPKRMGLQRITETPMNMVDSLTRRATSLQKTIDIADGAIHINSVLAKKNKLTDTNNAKVVQNQEEVAMKVIIDERVPDNCVLIQSAHPNQIQLGGAFGPIKIGKQ